MSGLATLILAGLRNSYRRKAAVLLLFGLSALFVFGLVFLVCTLAIVPELRSPHPDAARVRRYLGLIVYGSGLLAMGVNLNVFTANNLVKEKAQRLFESLLAAPLEARTLWLGKSLAVFLPGLVLCETWALAAWLAVHTLVATPRMGVLASPTMVFNGLALVPILYLPLSCLVLLVALSGSPITGNVIANVALSALAPIVVNLVARAGLDVGSSAFTVAHLALTGVVALVVLLVQSRLTKERIVLSRGT